MKRILCLLLIILMFSGLSFTAAKNIAKTRVNKDPEMKSVTSAGVTFSWETDGSILLGKLESQSTGWLAVGFGGDSMGSVGKIVIGAVSGKQVNLQIQAITGRRHSLAPGTIIASSGLEFNGTTSINFKISLADLGLTGKKGKPLLIILARHTMKDDFSVYHGWERGRQSIIF